MSFWNENRTHRAAPAVIGHRGAPDLATENTARSVELAMSVGADIVETDVRLTADGHIVCFHDANFQRLCGRNERVDSVSLSDARAIFPELLEFDDFLELTRDWPVIVDTKFCGRVQIDRFVEAVENHAAFDRSLFSSYSPEIATMIRERSKHANIGTFFLGRAVDLEATHSVGAKWVRVMPEDYAPSILGEIHAAGLSTIAIASPLAKVCTSTDRPALEQLASLGIDAIITSRPEFAVELFGDVVPGRSAVAGERDI
ncbi:glycerophosphodiester phosphodiesterase [Burkholderia cepacia]|uniref:glycerophosphodiester phosphodiesterase n=1 Tax=Burkholderia cepacia TaxID=292 RepID=UPI002AB78F1F|nr:glycerophosphodiester phosphodiesterase [Burkholderia cepacia]